MEKKIYIYPCLNRPFSLVKVKPIRPDEPAKEFLFFQIIGLSEAEGVNQRGVPMPSVRKNQLEGLRSTREKFSEGPGAWNSTKEARLWSRNVLALQNVIENVFHEHVGTDPVGVSDSVLHRGAGTRGLDLPASKEVRPGLLGQCQNSWSLWNASWWVFLSWRFVFLIVGYVIFSRAHVTRSEFITTVELRLTGSWTSQVSNLLVYLKQYLLTLKCCEIRSGDVELMWNFCHGT